MPNTKMYCDLEALLNFIFVQYMCVLCLYEYIPTERLN